MSRNESAPVTIPWPHSGRGETRPQTARARRTNAPFELPPGLRGQSPEGRRWRDLAAHYSAQLGPERIKREDVRARLRLVLWLTIEIERAQNQRLCQEMVPLQTVMYMQKELRVLLAQLGLWTVVIGPRPQALGTSP